MSLRRRLIARATIGFLVMNKMLKTQPSPPVLVGSRALLFPAEETAAAAVGQWGCIVVIWDQLLLMSFGHHLLDHHLLLHLTDGWILSPDSSS